MQSFQISRYTDGLRCGAVWSSKIAAKNAGVAQLVERNLAKVEVESSRLFSRSRHEKREAWCFPFFWQDRDLTQAATRGASESKLHGAIAKRLCNGLQIRPARFDSGSRLQETVIVPDQTPRLVRGVLCSGSGSRVGCSVSAVDTTEADVLHFEEVIQAVF